MVVSRRLASSKTGVELGKHGGGQPSENEGYIEIYLPARVSVFDVVVDNHRTLLLREQRLYVSNSVYPVELGAAISTCDTKPRVSNKRKQGRSRRAEVSRSQSVDVAIISNARFMI